MNSVHNPLCHLFKIHCTVILCSHIRLGPTSDLCLPEFPTNILYVFLTSYIHATMPDHHTSIFPDFKRPKYCAAKSINYVLCLVIFCRYSYRQTTDAYRLTCQKSYTCQCTVCFNLHAKLSMRVPANMFLERKTAGHNQELHNMNLHAENPSNITNSVVHYIVSIFSANLFFLRPFMSSILSKSLGLYSPSMRDQVSYLYKTIGKFISFVYFNLYVLKGRRRYHFLTWVVAINSRNLIWFLFLPWIVYTFNLLLSSELSHCFKRFIYIFIYSRFVFTVLTSMMDQPLYPSLCFTWLVVYLSL